jgi:hypothetical protein
MCVHRLGLIPSTIVIPIPCVQDVNMIQHIQASIDGNYVAYVFAILVE